MSTTIPSKSKLRIELDTLSKTPSEHIVGGENCLVVPDEQVRKLAFSLYEQFESERAQRQSVEKELELCRKESSELKQENRSIKLQNQSLQAKSTGLERRIKDLEEQLTLEKLRREECKGAYPPTYVVWFDGEGRGWFLARPKTGENVTAALLFHTREKAEKSVKRYLQTEEAKGISSYHIIQLDPTEVVRWVLRRMLTGVLSLLVDPADTIFEVPTPATLGTKFIRETLNVIYNAVPKDSITTFGSSKEQPS